MEQTVSSAPLQLPRQVIVVNDQSTCDNASGFENLQLKEENRQLKDGAARILQAADEKFDAATSVLKKQLRHEADAAHAMRFENENLRARLDEALSQAEQAKQPAAHAYALLTSPLAPAYDGL